MGVGARGRTGMRRLDVYLIALDPTRGSEMAKTRPCVVAPQGGVNRHVRTVIVAPMTTKGHAYPTRVPCEFEGTPGQVVLDQIRTVDKSRLVKRLGRLDEATGVTVLETLRETFAP